MIKKHHDYEYDKVTVEDYDVGDYTWVTGRFSNGHVTATYSTVYNITTGELSLDLDEIYMVLIDQDGGEIRSYEGDQVDLTDKQMMEIEEYAKEEWYRKQ